MQSSAQMQVDLPAVIEIQTTGEMNGRTRLYEKHLGDMSGVYLDTEQYEQAVAESGPDTLIYFVNEHKYQDGPGALIVGTSTLLPGKVGDEFAVTRGHLHATANRAELYHCLSGHGVMMLETASGEVSTVELTPGKAVNVPGHWIHRSVNVGTEPFVTLFCYAADAGQNYDIIADAGGMKTMIIDDGAGSWTAVPNPRHIGYEG
ncbi:glucose-6-phosphate isomerase family protein [Arthrobacter psychrochitiniphilus]|uniref:glucose-6-phosphate isomerase family protein n=1 Tax=Arthrobacter psychrochitiniphilus TaxID=291045 RepID=UPI003F7C2EB6